MSASVIQVCKYPLLSNKKNSASPNFILKSDIKQEPLMKHSEPQWLTFELYKHLSPH